MDKEIKEFATNALKMGQPAVLKTAIHSLLAYIESQPTYDHYAPPPESIADDVELVWGYTHFDTPHIRTSTAEQVRTEWGGRSTENEHWLFPPKGGDAL